MNTPREQLDRVIQDIYDEFTRQRARDAELGAQIESLRRAFRLDEKEAALQKQESDQSLLKAMRSLTTIVQQLVEQQIDPLGEHAFQKSSEELYARFKAQRAKEVKQSLEYIAFLSTCGRTKTDRCPCGQHYGLCFTDPNGTVVEENMCPHLWWIKQSRLALAQGNLAGFHRSLPLPVYLEAYKRQPNDSV